MRKLKMSLYHTERKTHSLRNLSALAIMLTSLLLTPAAQGAWKYEHTFSTLNIWTSPRGAIEGPLSYESGGDEFHYSDSRPANVNDGAALTSGSWHKMGNGLMVRITLYKDGGGFSYMFGADGSTGYVEDYSGTHSGTAYIWNNDYLWEIDYTMYYQPFPEVVVPSGVVDLGTCHKSVGGRLSKEVRIGVRIHGYTNGGTYPLYRSITSSDTPAGGEYTDSNQNPITLGVDNEIISSVSSALPQDYTDTFNAVLDCDKAPIGNLTWSASVKYTIE
ncbi:MAG: hypothetical protein QM578_27255 [Pantoea sp.]|uniref:hypothetical protein n=1 Tax=Pantoea sp. TaxID=69393 RepID=UPI0039E29964